jgi:hypothetical protein
MDRKKRIAIIVAVLALAVLLTIPLLRHYEQ